MSLSGKNFGETCSLTIKARDSDIIYTTRLEIKLVDLLPV